MNWRVEAYIIAWNKEETIGFTIQHYKRFCNQVILYDNFSTDRTRDIAEAFGADVRLFGISGVLDDAEYLKIKNNCWKGSNADFVIVLDDDEILYEESITLILRDARMNGQTIFKPQGYNMHSDAMPKKEWLEITTGWKDDDYSKLCIFDPKSVDIGFQYGCHTHQKDFPKGRLIYGPNKIYLLHYCFIGGVDRIIKRWAEYEPRRQKSSVNIRWNLGHRYSKKESEIRQEWAESGAKSKELSGVIFT